MMKYFIMIMKKYLSIQHPQRQSNIFINCSNGVVQMGHLLTLVAHCSQMVV